MLATFMVHAGLQTLWSHWAEIDSGFMQSSSLYVSWSLCGTSPVSVLTHWGGEVWVGEGIITPLQNSASDANFNTGADTYWLKLAGNRPWVTATYAKGFLEIAFGKYTCKTRRKPALSSGRNWSAMCLQLRFQLTAQSSGAETDIQRCPRLGQRCSGCVLPSPSQLWDTSCKEE